MHKETLWSTLCDANTCQYIIVVECDKLRTLTEIIMQFCVASKAMGSEYGSQFNQEISHNLILFITVILEDDEDQRIAFKLQDGKHTMAMANHTLKCQYEQQ